MRTVFLFLLVVAMTLQVNSQEKTISGIVTSANDGAPIP